MLHHTKTKGDQGVGFVIANLLSNGIQVALPLSEHLPFDLIGIYPDGNLKKISVKYRKAKNGKIEINFRSIYSDKKGLHIKELNKSTVDMFAVYCPDTQTVYYFDHTKFGKSVSIRINKPKDFYRNNMNIGNNYMVP